MSQEYVFWPLVNVYICTCGKFCLYMDVEEYCFRGAAEEVSGSTWMEAPHG